VYSVLAMHITIEKMLEWGPEIGLCTISLHE